VKKAKSQVKRNNRAINAEKGLFNNMDTWGNGTQLREFSESFLPNNSKTSTSQMPQNFDFVFPLM
jgi:hypothetical protein